MSSGLDDFSLFELFRMEAEEQVRVLSDMLVVAEKNASDPETLQSLMRAAHSLKGAARIIGLDVVVDLTHAMEERVVAAQRGAALVSADIDRLLQGTDILARLQQVNEAEVNAWLAEHDAAIRTVAASFTEEPVQTAAAPTEQQTQAETALTAPAVEAPPPAPPAAEEKDIELEDDTSNGLFAETPDGAHRVRERSVRIAATGFDHIVSLSSHVLVASRQFVTQAEVIERVRHDLGRTLNELADAASDADRNRLLQEMERQLASLQARIAELDVAASSNERSAERMHRSVLAGRLRPFKEGIGGLARLVRETARDLGKQVDLEVLGENVRVDRDILEKLESPLAHLVTNAIDHGIGSPAERIAAGKSSTATVRVHARHENGRLVITVRDDGRGIHRDALREKIIRKELVTEQTAASLSDSELLEFIFLPGFSTRDQVSQVSGRGVGLNVVQSMVQEAGGAVTVTSEEAVGTVFRLTLPVTRSVMRVIRVLVDGEAYAIPLVRIDRVAELPVLRNTDNLGNVNLFVELDEERIPAARLSDLLGLSQGALAAGEHHVLVSGGVALTVDQLMDEQEVHVRRLDKRLGKIPGVSAASLDEKGEPLLILDVEDILQTMRGRTDTAPAESGEGRARILVVDDSHTVRELVRRMLAHAGYHVSTAQNGQEAWNLLRLNEYDLLISDVDMPQMNGIELVTKVRESPRLSTMPVIILSYKDSEDDRRRGLEAGADYYLTKGSFKNNTFLNAVVDLIGAAEWKGGAGA